MLIEWRGVANYAPFPVLVVIGDATNSAVWVSDIVDIVAAVSPFRVAEFRLFHKFLPCCAVVSFVLVVSFESTHYRAT